MVTVALSIIVSTHRLANFKNTFVLLFRASVYPEISRHKKFWKSIPIGQPNWNTKFVGSKLFNIHESKFYSGCTNNFVGQISQLEVV